MRPLSKSLVLLLSLAAAAHAQQPANKDWTAAGAAWWSHVQYLADDKLEGRKTGTPGYEAAVKYVESQYKAIGLKPAGVNGYRQDVELIPTSVDLTASSFTVDTTPYKLGEAVNLNPHINGGNTVDAPMVFIGYGLSVPRKHIDDLAGLDLRGRVVVVYNAAPETLQGPQRAYARGLGERWRALHAAGAIGIILIAPPRPGAPPPSAPTERTPRPTTPPTQLFADPALETLPGLKLQATLTPAGAATFFANSGHEFSEIKALADAGKPLPHFAFTGTVHARTVIAAQPSIKAPNVIGLLEGSDPKLKHEYLVISAHLDHLGVGRAVDGDTIYNGAMDNASGIASLIECAKLLAAGQHPRRSILFIALVGEELGELGSQYFATKPTVPKSAIVADLNMDMYLPLFPLRFLEVQGLGESTLGNDARAICQLNDVEPQFDKQPDENRFVRSDQVNFVKQGIPALAFKFGWVPDSPEMKTFNEWVKVRYHRPSDDLNQPVDKVGAAQFTSLLAQLATRVANAPTRPTWYPESSFATN
jgi:hypothetical protein